MNALKQIFSEEQLKEFRRRDKAISENLEYAISGPMGAFMNHVRWLLMVTEHSTLYDFVLEEVYPSDRTAFNWLDYEWKFRMDPKYNTTFAIHHGPEAILEDMPKLKKLLFLDYDPDLCLKHYLKLNPTLNGVEVDYFLQVVKYISELQDRIVRDNPNIGMLKLDVDVLLDPILDVEFYNRITTFFDLVPNYELASEVHKAWYKLNLAAEEAMLSLPKDIEDFPWISGSVMRLLTTQEDYDKLLELIRKIYA